MQSTGNSPVRSVVPPLDDALPPGPSSAARGLDPESPHHHDDVPAGLLDALLHAPELESDRLDRARAWLRQHQDHVDDVPTCDELAGCILQDTVGTAIR